MDRFDLEQKIMHCWSIIEDLKLSEDEYCQALAVVYEMKFNDLWSCFELLVSNRELN
jgi:hypothetical protein